MNESVSGWAAQSFSADSCWVLSIDPGQDDCKRFR
jgi:hypothetical protein